jgi:hypothetical protein
MQATNRISRRTAILWMAVSGVLAQADTSIAATLLTFDEFNARAPGVQGQPVIDYFAAAGVTVTGDSLVVQDVRDFTDRGVEFTAPASRFNFLGGTKSPQNNTWTFPTPMTEVSFIRNSLITTGPGGTTHPEWQATAYDSAGLVLGTVGEDLIATFGNIPPTLFTLSGLPGRPIKSIQWHSDHHNFAGYGAVILDNVQLKPIPEPATLSLLTGGLFAIGWPRQRRRSGHPVLRRFTQHACILPHAR